MSDVPPVDAAPPAEPIDPEFAALIERLSPFFADVAKAAVAEAAASTPTTTYRPATVLGVDLAARTASVQCDGDAAAITAQLLVEIPGFNDRVMVEFRAAGAVFVTGFITACGTPPGSLMAYAGPITAHAGAVSSSATPGQPPRGWLWCAGQAVSRSQYSALFAAIGTTHGAGDGATTFNVPDYRGRDFRGLDNMGGSDAGRISAANTLGAAGGNESVTLSSSNLPSHTHDLSNHTHSLSGSVSGTTGSSNANTSLGFTPLTTGGGNGYDNAGAGSFAVGGSINDGGHSHSFSGSVSGTSGGPSNNTSGSTGSGSAVNTLPPYLLCHILIKA